MGLSSEMERQVAVLDNATVGAVLLDFFLDPQVNLGGIFILPGSHRPDWVADCPGAADRLLRAWSEGPEVTRAKVLRLLSGCNDPRVDAVLRQALADESPVLRAAAAEAMGWQRSPAQVPWLMACWNRETEGSVRRALLEALGEIGEPRSRSLFMAALEDADIEVRAAAVRGLGTFPNPATVGVLEEVFWNDPSPEVHSEVLTVLEKIGNRVAQSLLLQAAHDADPLVRARAIHALGKLRVRDAVETLRLRLQDPDSNVRTAAIHSLARILGRESLPDLRKACEDEDFSVRCGALRQVERLGLTASMGLEWVQVLGDLEAIVRLEALRILRNFPGPLPPEVLQAVWDIQEHDDLPYLRRLAERVLDAPGRSSQSESPRLQRESSGRNREGDR
jgi:HEAT repeat protein